MRALKLTLKFPTEYLEYDDIESLWHYGIRNSSSIEVDFENLELKSEDNKESIITKFKDIFDLDDTKNILYKWIAEILIECDKYYVENIQNIDGGNFLIFHSLVQFSVLEDDLTILSFEKRLNELIEYHSADEVIYNFRNIKIKETSESSEMTPDNIFLIKRVLENELNLKGRLSFFSFEKLYKENGFDIIESSQYGHLRYEIKIENTYLAISSSDYAPSEPEFIVSNFAGYKISGNW